MEWDPDLIRDALASLVGAAIASIFGLLRYVQTYLDPATPPFKWWVAAIKGLMGAASGLLAAWLLIEWGLAYKHIGLFGVVTALAGWGGVEFIDAIKEGVYDFLRKRIGATRTPKGDEDHATEN